jgi:hypothetical protein
VPASATTTSPLKMVQEQAGNSNVTVEMGVVAVSAEFWLCPKAASAEVEKAASSEAVSTLKEADMTTSGSLEQVHRQLAPGFKAIPLFGIFKES